MDKPFLRIGDAERDAAIELLQTHYAAGRLTTEEFDERMTTALGAHSQDELDQLLVDLPDDPEARFFDENGPVGRAALPSELTPWQAATPAVRPRPGAVSTVLGAISGLVWPAALVAFLCGAPWQVWVVALAVSMTAGALRGTGRDRARAQRRQARAQRRRRRDR